VDLSVNSERRSEGNVIRTQNVHASKNQRAGQLLALPDKPGSKGNLRGSSRDIRSHSNRSSDSGINVVKRQTPQTLTPGPFQNGGNVTKGPKKVNKSYNEDSLSIKSQKQMDLYSPPKQVGPSGYQTVSKSQNQLAIQSIYLISKKTK
jgi:hypothetical protein